MSAAKKIQPPLVVDPNQPYSIEETSAILRQCRAQTYKDFTAKRLVGFKKGRRTYVLGKEIIRASAAQAAVGTVGTMFDRVNPVQPPSDDNRT